MSGIQIKEIAFIGYAVTDIARSRKFYGEILGLRETATFEHEGEIGWVEYDLLGQTLALAKAFPEWQPSPHGGGVCLEVADLDQAVAYLKEVGATLPMEIGDYPVCRMALVSDPDGNTIALHQRKPEHPDHS